jgi:hypothetical protein
VRVKESAPSVREAHQVVKLYSTINAVNKRQVVRTDKIYNLAIMQMPQICQNKSSQVN